VWHATLACHTILLALATILGVRAALTTLLSLIVAAAGDPSHTARSRTLPAVSTCKMSDDSTTQAVLQAATGLCLGCIRNGRVQRHGGKGNSYDLHAAELRCLPKA
jgi:hypothetical protein